jgi:protocatechuate 3,4-dioxygenase, alpha subunit
LECSTATKGINIGLNTRMYFEDEDNVSDPVLNLIEQENRRQTLLARRTAPGVYRFDIRLQGEGETVFLDI